jgi:hypothetical protein
VGVLLHELCVSRRALIFHAWTLVYAVPRSQLCHSTAAAVFEQILGEPRPKITAAWVAKLVALGFAWVMVAAAKQSGGNQDDAG